MKKNNCVLNSKETCSQKRCNQDLEPLFIKLLDDVVVKPSTVISVEPTHLYKV